MLSKFVERQFREFVKSGGVSVSPEHAEARINKCKDCPFFGIVEPIDGLKMEGCTKCGCPSSTKPHFLTHFRIKGKERESLTIKELIMIKAGGREDVIEIKTECPHEDGNKWESIDKEFLK